MSNTSFSKSVYSLRNALILLTIDQLKPLLDLLSKKDKPTRKGDLVSEIENALNSDTVKDIWQRLDALQQAAVAETLYSPNGTFDQERFHAKYGNSPIFEVETSRFFSTPTLLSLIIYQHSFIPSELQTLLLPMVKKPESISIKGISELPEKETLTLRCMENEALFDLPQILQLIEQGKIVVSEKTGIPSKATIMILEKSLAEHDFYPIHAKKENNRDQDIGPIKCFSWPMILQLSKFVEKHGKKLSLTANGRSAMRKAKHESIRTLWNRWLKSRNFDEFSRINEIKGQQRSKSQFTSVIGRRDKVTQTLKVCPVGEWVSVDSIFRYMQATDLNFEISRAVHKLYLCEPDYGSLGYDGYHNWSILQGRYVLCLLFEYAATLGIIDVAYENPDGALNDFQDQWGGDDLNFLSRYDGLRHIRITELGAFCLGISQHYDPEQSMPRAPLELTSELEIISKTPISREEMLELTAFANTSDDVSWVLDEGKTISAVEQGRSIKSFEKFLELRYEKPLPKSFKAFFKKSQQNSNALRILNTALIIDCQTPERAQLFVTNKKTKSYCQLLGETQLVVPLSSEDAFRKAVKGLKLGVVSMS